MNLSIRMGDSPYNAPKVKAPTEYARGFEAGVLARKSGKYSAESVTRFLNANRHAKDGYTLGYCDGLSNVERG